MKIIILSDYFYPFNPGGAEWSTFYIAKSLKDKGSDIEIFTPNYGVEKTEVFNGLLIKRFSFPFKIKDLRKVVNPILQNNPIFFLWSAVFLLICYSFRKVDLFHVQGKYLIPGAWLVGKMIGIPTVVTIRDKQLLCSYGKCFFTKDRFKRCGWIEYLTVDLVWFYKNYVPRKNLRTFSYTFLSAIWARLMNDTIAFFAKRADKIIAISNSQKRYLLNNGFKNVDVIYNSIDFKTNTKSGGRKDVLYAGKLSLGKGVYELLDAIPNVLKKHQVKFLFAGGIDDKEKIKSIIDHTGIAESVRLLGGVDHFKLQRLYRSVNLVVMPSIFPEAFGRVALEALAAGTPVVVSDRGGLPEIVDNKRTGLVCDASSFDLARSINEILNNLGRYQKNIINAQESLRIKFEIEPIENHIKLYKKIIK